MCGQREFLKKAGFISVFVQRKLVQAAEVRQAHDVTGKGALFEVDIICGNVGR